MQWVSDAGGALLNGSRILFDSNDDIFISGSYQSEVTFGSKTLPEPKNYSDPFVGKFNKAGEVVWAQYIRNLGCCIPVSSPNSILDSQGNIYIIGRYSSKTQIGPTTLPYVGDDSMYFAKLNSNGDYLWVKNVISNTDYINMVAASDIAVQSNGEIIVVGSFNGEAEFDHIKLVS